MIVAQERGNKLSGAFGDLVEKSIEMSRFPLLARVDVLKMTL
jgi:hypothetical protein